MEPFDKPPFKNFRISPLNLVPKNAPGEFRLIHHLLGLEWEGNFYFDRCLPMGCSSSCNIFETFSTAFEWIASTKLQASAVIHILDDFLFLAPSYNKCPCHRESECLSQIKKIGPQCVLGVLFLIKLFLSVGILFSNASICELNCYK